MLKVDRKFVVELVNTYLKMYRRFGEHIFQNNREVADTIIKFAHETFEDGKGPKSTLKQIRRFRKKMEKEVYAGNFYPSMEDLSEENFDWYFLNLGEPKINGLSLAKSIMYHRNLWQNQILFFAEAIADMVLELIKKSPDVEDKHVPMIAKSLTRSIIGHERRHKTQSYYECQHNEPWKYLMYKKAKNSLFVAKEEDADWFAERFMEWFWDTADKLELEKHWFELSELQQQYGRCA